MCARKTSRSSRHVAERFGEQNKAGADDLRILIPAFMVSELRRGFEIGFLITLPFLVIDLVVATIMTAMGMMMMPPTVVSLPLKILFFVLVDGWSLLVGGARQIFQLSARVELLRLPHRPVRNTFSDSPRK